MSHRLFITVLCAGALIIGARAAAADGAAAAPPAPAAVGGVAVLAPAAGSAAVADSASLLPVLGWWSIAEMLSARHLVRVTARPEIQPWFVSPQDATRAVEFRGAVPNPFRSETAIRFTLPSEAHVTLRVYDVAGKQVRSLVDAQLPSGDHSALFSGRDLHAGIYFAVLRVGTMQVSRSIVLAR